MFMLDQHVSTQCVDYETCHARVRALKRLISAHFSN